MSNCVSRILFSGVVAGLLLSPMATIATAQDTAIVSQKAATISEAQIRQILDEVVTASRKQDVEGLVKYLAPAVKIDITLQAGNAAPQTISLTRDDYRKYLTQSISTIEKYKITSSSPKIEIAADGQSAVASYRLLEESQLKGQPITIRATTDESTRFELVEGQVLATSVTSQAVLEVAH